MDFMLILAQATEIKPDEAIGWAERMSKGGVPVIALCGAIASTVALVYVFMRLLAAKDERTELEKTYRTDLEARAKATIAEAEKRIGEAKLEAKERAQEIDKLMRERIAVEKESDSSFARAILALEANTKLLEKNDRQQDEVKNLLQRVILALDDRRK